jgi:hypothetical protein
MVNHRKKKMDDQASSFSIVYAFEKDGGRERD